MRKDDDNTTNMSISLQQIFRIAKLLATQMHPAQLHKGVGNSANKIVKRNIVSIQHVNLSTFSRNVNEYTKEIRRIKSDLEPIPIGFQGRHPS
jgi:hypothetical protein